MTAHSVVSTSLSLSAGDGTALAADSWGDGAQPPVIFLHGGGQTRHAWKATARVVADHGFHTLTVDLRGHGDSGWSADGVYSMERFVGDLRTVVASLERPPVLIGASLGGITGLLAEGEGPALLRALVLVDVTPTVQSAGVERINQFMGEKAADGFLTVEEAADAISMYLPHRPRPDSLTGLAKNLRLHADGRYRWHWDPALLNFSGTLDARMSGRLVAAAARLSLPALLVRGGASELVSQADVDEFLRLVPHARYVDIADARHMVAGDENDHFGAAVVEFIRQLPSPNSLNG